MALREGTAAQSLERILIYGDPKIGKTRLATHLPERFGSAVYVAFDPGSASLPSTAPSYAARLKVLEPVPDATGRTAPDEDAFNLALTDWKAKYPEDNIRTLIWDTMTATATACLSYIADQGQFSQEKHIRIGGTVSGHNLPIPGDYGGAQNMMDRLRTFLFQQPLHLIVICHADVEETKLGIPIHGGPALVGKAKIRTYAGWFDSVIHLARQTVIDEKGGRSALVAYTEGHDIWIGGTRSQHLNNPLPRIELDPDPINFWNARDAHLGSQTAQS